MLMNRVKMEITYSLICDELKKVKDVETMERLIFLVQFDSLNLYGFAFLPYEMYLYDNTIRIRYMSDLLRIERNVYINYQGFNITNILKHLKLFSKYKNMNEIEIENKVKNIIEKNTLDDKYFKKQPYKNKIERILARLRIKKTKYFIQSAVRVLFCVIGITALFSVTYLYLTHKSKYSIERVIEILIIGIIGLVIYSIWTCIWMKPSKHEISIYKE